MGIWFKIFVVAALSICSQGALFGNENESVEPIATHDDARENLLKILSGEWVARGVYAAAKLEIADHLQHGSKSVEELSLLTMSEPSSLTRLLHMLASFGIFEEISPEIFANTDTSRLLIKTNPNTLHSLSLFYGEDIHKSWDELFSSIQTGTPAFELSFKKPVFSYLKDNPERAILFQEAMKEKSQAVIQSALSNYDFGQFRSICDVGGGHGQFIQAILQIHSRVSGVIFDLPQVIEKVKQQNSLCEGDRCELISGDFFVSIPKAKDAYLLKSVIHDWNDLSAQQILNNCHQAMRPDSRLLIVEVVLQHNEENSYAKCMDFLMMAITGGKERSLSSMTKLLEKSGFTLERIYPTATEFSILEVKKSRRHP